MRRQHKRKTSQASIYSEVPFFDEINALYPGKQKMLCFNFSFDRDGLFYVVVHNGTTPTQQKTIVIGNKDNILLTSTQSFPYRYSTRAPFAIDGYFGFGGTTSSTSNKNAYINYFKYDIDNNTLGALQTIQLGNYLNSNIFAFEKNGVHYVQTTAQTSSVETQQLVNITAKSRQATAVAGQRFMSTIVDVNDGSSTPYIHFGGFCYSHNGSDGNNRDWSFMESSKAYNITNTTNTTILSNTLSCQLFGNTCQLVPVWGGKKRLFVSAYGQTNKAYEILYNNDYTQISLGSLYDTYMYGIAPFCLPTSEGKAWVCNKDTFEIEYIEF